MKYITHIIIWSLFLFSCVQAEEKIEEKKDRNIENNDNHNHESSKLHLNDGEKWQVNKETGEGIANMVSIMEDFDITSNDEGYLALNDTLDKEFRYIFKMCTAEGEAHDQLHVLLFPLRGMFQRLKEPEDAVREEAVENIKKQLDLYSTFFE
jgi:hypothetical protein